LEQEIHVEEINTFVWLELEESPEPSAFAPTPASPAIEIVP
jgi:hypothetical protein